LEADKGLEGALKLLKRAINDISNVIAVMSMKSRD